MTSAVTERGTIMNLAVQTAPAKPGISDTGFTQVMDKAVSANKNGGADGSAAVRETAQTPESTKKAAESNQPKTEEARQTEDACKTETAQQETPEAVNEQTQKADQTVNAGEDTNEAGEEAAASEVAGMFMEKAVEIFDQVAEKLAFSPEAVADAMQELGMGMTDLLNPNRMTELIMQLTGEDQMSLLTNEALYNTMQEMTLLSKDAGEELMEQLSLTPEDLKAMLEKFGEAEAASGKMDTVVSGMQEQKPDAPIANTDERTSGLIAEQNKQQTNPAQQMEMSHMTNHAENSTQQNEAQMTAGREADGDSTQTREDGESFTEGGQGFADQMTNRTNEFTEALTQETNTPRTYVDAGEIMKQITDFMRTHLNAQGSSVELQLHPASLGTLNIAVTAKNGIVTAQFTAQDEAVRTILENQVAELRSRLDEQGVKVEAIEVTVSSHEFERNLEQNADQDADERGEAEAKRRTTRRLNLDEPGDGEAEELDDAEQIARDMMRIHGNRLDYLV